MFIFLNTFRILFDSNWFEVPTEFKKFLLALKIQQSFILFIYFSHYKIWKILGCDIIEHLRTPSVKGADIDNPDRAESLANMVTKIPRAWTKPFMEYLEHGTLRDDEVERRQIV